MVDFVTQKKLSDTPVNINATIARTQTGTTQKGIGLTGTGLAGGAGVVQKGYIGTGQFGVVQKGGYQYGGVGQYGVNQQLGRSWAGYIGGLQGMARYPQMGMAMGMGMIAIATPGPQAMGMIRTGQIRPMQEVDNTIEVVGKGMGKEQKFKMFAGELLAVHSVLKGSGQENMKPEDMQKALQDKYGIDTEIKEVEGRKALVNKATGNTIMWDGDGNNMMNENDIKFDDALAKIKEKFGIDETTFEKTYDITKGGTGANTGQNVPQNQEAQLMSMMNGRSQFIPGGRSPYGFGGMMAGMMGRMNPYGSMFASMGQGLNVGMSPAYSYGMGTAASLGMGMSGASGIGAMMGMGAGLTMPNSLGGMYNGLGFQQQQPGLYGYAGMGMMGYPPQGGGMMGMMGMAGIGGMMGAGGMQAAGSMQGMQGIWGDPLWQNTIVGTFEEAYRYAGMYGPQTGLAGGMMGLMGGMMGYPNYMMGMMGGIYGNNALLAMMMAMYGGYGGYGGGMMGLGGMMGDMSGMYGGANYVDPLWQ